MKKNLLTFADVKMLHQMGQRTEAKQGYLILLDENPSEVEVLHWLGILYAEENNLDEAEHCLQKAIALREDDPTLKLHLANILKAKGAYVEAATLLQKMIQVHPDFAAAFNNLGSVYFAQEKWQEAIEAYQLALDKQPNYIDAYYNLGLAYNKLNKQSEAINAYEALLALSPNQMGARFQ